MNELIKLIQDIKYILAFRAGLITAREAYMKTGIISESHVYKMAMEDQDDSQ